MKTIGIILSLGDLYQNHGLGALKFPIDGVVDRIDSILAKAKKENWTDLILMNTAGYSKNSPQKPQPNRQVSLSEQLVRFLKENLPAVLDNLISIPLCWSTRDEVRVGIKLAIRLKYADRSETARLLIASNWAHLPRIWLYSRMYAPQKWKVRLLTARRVFSFRDSLIIEPIKTARDLLYCFQLFKRFWYLKKLSNRQKAKIY